MTARGHAKVGRAQLILDAYHAAKAVELHAEALARASEGQITLRTAHDLRTLAKRLAKLDAARPRRGVGPVRSTILAAKRITRALHAAIAALPGRDAELEEQLRRSRPTPSNSAADVLAVLDLNLFLYRRHGRRVRALFPADFDDELARVRAALYERPALNVNANAERRAHRRELMWTQEQLMETVRLVRALVTVIEKSASLIDARSRASQE